MTHPPATEFETQPYELVEQGRALVDRLRAAGSEEADLVSALVDAVDKLDRMVDEQACMMRGIHG